MIIDENQLLSAHNIRKQQKQPPHNNRRKRLLLKASSYLSIGHKAKGQKDTEISIETTNSTVISKHKGCQKKAKYCNVRKFYMNWQKKST